jgi:hypothetical protein
MVTIAGVLLSLVMPAQARIQRLLDGNAWIPACAGMTIMENISRYG